MREIRQSGLEGGETNMLGLPYPIDPPEKVVTPRMQSTITQWISSSALAD